MLQKGSDQAAVRLLQRAHPESSCPTNGSVTREVAPGGRKASSPVVVFSRVCSVSSFQQRLANGVLTSSFDSYGMSGAQHGIWPPKCLVAVFCGISCCHGWPVSLLRLDEKNPKGFLGLQAAFRGRCKLKEALIAI